MSHFPCQHQGDDMEGRSSGKHQSPYFGQFSEAKNIHSQGPKTQNNATDCYHSIKGELVDVHGEEGVVHVDVAVDVDHSPGLVEATEVIHAAVAVVGADGVRETRVEIIDLIDKTVLSVKGIPFAVHVKRFVLGSGDLVVVIKPKRATIVKLLGLLENNSNNLT